MMNPEKEATNPEKEAREVGERAQRHGEDPPSHETRCKIVEAIKETPGMNKNQLRKELGIGMKILDHHLRELTHAELVLRRASAQGKEHLYFHPDDEELWENPRTRIMFGRCATRNVGLYISENPGATTKEIAEALGIAPVTVRHHLRTLRDHQIITSAKVGRSYEYHPLRELREWVDEHGDVYKRPWMS